MNKKELYKRLIILSLFGGLMFLGAGIISVNMITSFILYTIGMFGYLVQINKILKGFKD